MWKCHKCGKPVYFAERRQSLGFDWHPWCLKCEECGKVLNPGNHAEHKSTPYCHIPCYSALFGPKLFGHGSTVESHQSFGHRSNSFIREQSALERQVREYNAHFDRSGDVRLGVSHREVNGRLVLEGVLRVHWGIDNSVRLREYNDNRVIAKSVRERNCVSMVVAPTTASPVNKDDEESESEDEQEEVEPKKNGGGEADFPFSCRPRVTRRGSSFLEESSRGARIVAAAATSFKRGDRRYRTLPARLNSGEDKKKRREEEWDEIDELLAVERADNDGEDGDEAYRVYHTVQPAVTLPARTRLSSHGGSCVPFSAHLDRVRPSEDIPNDLERKKNGLNTLEKLFHDSKKEEDDVVNANANVKKVNDGDAADINGNRDGGEGTGPMSLPVVQPQSSFQDDKIVRGAGPRALRRRHGKKMDRSKVVRRKSSINGHWYDRDTSVFTPPKGSCMSAHISSLLPTPEVVRMLLDKYQVESEAEEFALYVVKDTGERRLVRDHEFPLRLRVSLGPHDDVSKLYLMDRRNTSEIRLEVANYLRFSYTECRSFLNMFYEQEEAEVEYIRYKYKQIKRMMRERAFDLRVQF